MFVFTTDGLHGGLHNSIPLTEIVYFSSAGTTRRMPTLVQTDLNQPPNSFDIGLPNALRGAKVWFFEMPATEFPLKSSNNEPTKRNINR